MRPVRLLGREGNIKGQNVSVFINNIYSEHEKYILLEVEVPASSEKIGHRIADVEVSYGNMLTRGTDKLSRTVCVSFSDSKELVTSNTNADVMVDVVELIATERNELAVKLRDEGKIDKAEQVLVDNEAYLGFNFGMLRSSKKAGKLKEYEQKQEEDRQNLRGSDWGVQRKRMRQTQTSNRQQQ